MAGRYELAGCIRYARRQKCYAYFAGAWLMSQSGCAMGTCKKYCRNNERVDGSKFKGGGLVAGI